MHTAGENLRIINIIFHCEIIVSCLLSVCACVHECVHMRVLFGVCVCVRANLG